MSLARGPMVPCGRHRFKRTGQGLARFENRAVRSFVTGSFDGSKFGIFALHFDREGNLWLIFYSLGMRVP